MRRAVAESLELDDDPSRVDLDALYLSQQSYWARDRTRERTSVTGVAGSTHPMRPS
jgi:hypothetical protein